MIAGAVRTDFILSAEIMVIALDEVTDQAFVARAIILVVVAIGITALVYGVVALIVKMDDVGLHLAQRSSTARPACRARPGRGDAAAARRHLGVVGIAAMTWVGGHILLVGVDDLGWHAPYDLVHHLEEACPRRRRRRRGRPRLARQHRSVGRGRAGRGRGRRRGRCTCCPVARPPPAH